MWSSWLAFWDYGFCSGGCGIIVLASSVCLLMDEDKRLVVQVMSFREMYVKTTERLSPHKKITKKSTNDRCWRGCEEKGIILHHWWECKLIQPQWRTAWRLPEKLKIELPCMCAKSLQACPALCNPVDWGPPGSCVHRNFPGKNTGVGCHALLQRIFLTQGLNPHLVCLLH